MLNVSAALDFSEWNHCRDKINLHIKMTSRAALRDRKRQCSAVITFTTWNTNFHTIKHSVLHLFDFCYFKKNQNIFSLNFTVQCISSYLVSLSLCCKISASPFIQHPNVHISQMNPAATWSASLPTVSRFLRVTSCVVFPSFFFPYICEEEAALARVQWFTPKRHRFFLVSRVHCSCLAPCTWNTRRFRSWNF